MNLYSLFKSFAVMIGFLLPLIASTSIKDKVDSFVPETKHQAEVTPVTFVRKERGEENMGKRLSKGERLCRKVINDLIQEKRLTANVKFNFRPDFLKNPKTGRNVEIDIFIEVVKPFTKEIAVEFNGRQHDEFVAKFHKKQSEFFNQQFRDRLKADVCKERGIELVVISHSDVDHLKTDDEKISKIREMLEGVFEVCE